MVIGCRSPLSVMIHHRMVPFPTIGILPPTPLTDIELTGVSSPMKSERCPESVAEVQLSTPMGKESESKVVLVIFLSFLLSLPLRALILNLVLMTEGCCSSVVAALFTLLSLRYVFGQVCSLKGVVEVLPHSSISSSVKS